MNGYLLLAAVTAGPAALIGPVLLTAHLRDRRQDIAQAAVYAELSRTPPQSPHPPDGGTPAPAPRADAGPSARLASVHDLDTHRRRRAA